MRLWMIWTKGWGVRAWWWWFSEEGFPMAVAWLLPRRIALWTFIRVYAADGQAPGPEYTRVYKAWENGAGGGGPMSRCRSWWRRMHGLMVRG